MVWYEYLPDGRIRDGKGGSLIKIISKSNVIVIG